MLVQFAIADQLFHVGDALEALPLELFKQETNSAECLVELRDVASGRPCGLNACRLSVSSASRVPNAPARIPTFIKSSPPTNTRLERP